MNNIFLTYQRISPFQVSNMFLLTGKYINFTHYSSNNIIFLNSTG